MPVKADSSQRLFTSPSYGKVDIDRVVSLIRDRVEKAPDGAYEVMLGTDSQNFDTTKVVCVIALHEVGHGGIFFYDITHTNRITNVGAKLLYETQLSLDCASELIDAFARLKEETGFDYEKRLCFSIHVDAGENGPSKKVIPEVVGWINACGYNAVVKPDSVAASAIANKFSK